MSNLMRCLAAVAAAGFLSFAGVSPAPAADLGRPQGVKPASTAKTPVLRKRRIVRHRAARHGAPAWIWVRRAHTDHHEYAYRPFGRYFARGRPSCWC